MAACGLRTAGRRKPIVLRTPGLDPPMRPVMLPVAVKARRRRGRTADATYGSSHALGLVLQTNRGDHSHWHLAVRASPRSRWRQDGDVTVVRVGAWCDHMSAAE
jgi:hypothetical protein